MVLNTFITAVKGDSDSKPEAERVLAELRVSSA